MDVRPNRIQAVIKALVLVKFIRVSAVWQEPSFPTNASAMLTCRLNLRKAGELFLSYDFLQAEIVVTKLIIIAGKIRFNGWDSNRTKIHDFIFLNSRGAFFWTHLVQDATLQIYKMKWLGKTLYVSIFTCLFKFMFLFSKTSFGRLLSDRPNLRIRQSPAVWLCLSPINRIRYSWVITAVNTGIKLHRFESGLRPS